MFPTGAQGSCLWGGDGIRHLSELGAMAALGPLFLAEAMAVLSPGHGGRCDWSKDSRGKGRAVGKGAEPGQGRSLGGAEQE